MSWVSKTPSLPRIQGCINKFVSTGFLTVPNVSHNLKNEIYTALLFFHPAKGAQRVTPSRGTGLKGPSHACLRRAAAPPEADPPRWLTKGGTAQPRTELSPNELFMSNQRVPLQFFQHLFNCKQLKHCYNHTSSLVMSKQDATLLLPH